MIDDNAVVMSPFPLQVDHGTRTINAQVREEEPEVIWVEEGYYRRLGDGFVVRFCTLFPCFY
jgi:hypothetical protein